MRKRRLNLLPRVGWLGVLAALAYRVGLPSVSALFCLALGWILWDAERRHPRLEPRLPIPREVAS